MEASTPLAGVLQWFQLTAVRPAGIFEAGKGGLGMAGGGIQTDMFDDSGPQDGVEGAGFSESDAWALAGLYSDEGVDLSSLPPNEARLFEFSVDAFSAVIHARASGDAVRAAADRFGRKVLGAADAAGMSANAASPAGRKRTESAMRRAAEIAAGDALDPDARAVYDAANRVRHEICRLRGFLRFGPAPGGVYVASCAPDHFILPALAAYFRKRFGGTPWAIIDERRRLRLSHAPGRRFELTAVAGAVDGESPPPEEARDGGWEALWRRYHGAVSNADRSNPELQAKFVPRRYREHMTEFVAE